MLRYLLTTLLFGTLSACSPVPQDAAICDASRGDRQDHAAALLADGGPQSQATGVRLLARMDAACK